MLQGTLTKRKVEGNKIGGDALVLLNSKERKVAVRKERVTYTQIRVILRIILELKFGCR